MPGSGSATYALVDAAMSRLALDTGGTSAWSVFDLHGNLAAATAEASASIVNAVRHDAWGSTLDAWTAGAGSTATPWRFQGRLDVSPDPDEPLYDFGGRLYRPSGGTFTQLDTYAGTAQNPLSMNRFLYAHANPSTLIDPTGHCVTCGPTLLEGGQIPKQEPAQQMSAPTSRNDSVTVDEAAVILQAVLHKVFPTQLAYHPCWNLNCTPSQIEALTPRQKQQLPEIFERRTGAEGWFAAVEEIIQFMRDTGQLEKGSWFSVVDSYILAAIQDGAALAEDEIAARRGAGSIPGTDLWSEFFTGQALGTAEDQLLYLWGTAEDAATKYGVGKADGRSLLADPSARFALITMGDVWRAGVADAPDRADALEIVSYGGPHAGPMSMVIGVESWVFDPRSEGIAYALAYGFYSAHRSQDFALEPSMPVSPIWHWYRYLPALFSLP